MLSRDKPGGFYLTFLNFVLNFISGMFFWEKEYVEFAASTSTADGGSR
jgi:hypothetical protein